MFKKIFAIATVMCVIPMMANAATKWQLGTRAMSQGGVVNSRNMTGQTVTNGSIFKQYTTATSPTVTVIPNAGFKISKISENGFVSVPAAGTYTSTNTGTSNFTLQATFARIAYSISATAGTGGTLDKTSYPVVYAGVQSPAKSFTFTPNPGQYVSAITVTGAGAVAQNLNAVTGLPVTLPAAAGVKVKTNITQVGTANVTVAAAFGGTATVTPPPIGSTGAAGDARNQCVNCHATQGVGGGFAVDGAYYNWSTSGHKRNAHGPQACYICHAGANAGAHPGNVQCASCHAGVSHDYPQGSTGAIGTGCAVCHTTTNASPDAHAKEDGCIDCHATARNAGSQYVQDNNGVRSITQEFTKWSHHVTGVELNNSHCAACHLAGKQSPYGVHVDPTKHMTDNKIHLRNADDDTDMVWDPAAPSHSTMDNYCMSCHDANGATSAASVVIQNFINTNHLAAAGKTASPSNPFGDTISNRYDKMQRPAVVDASSQFNTSNNSHHAVKGPRYSGRTRVAGARAITSPATFAKNSSATLKGVRKTMYDAGVLNQLYVPLEDAAGEVAPRTGSDTLGDDSTLHCGDCHTVGQWKPGVATNNLGVLNTVAIGAHGSNNEYLLRNNIGTDARHYQNTYVVTAGVVTNTNAGGAFLVCYNCHAFSQYGSVFNATGVTGPHAGEYASAGRCDGAGNTLTFNGYTTGTQTDGTQFASRFEGPATKYSATPAFAPGFPLGTKAPGSVEQNPDFGNIFGIQCANCHNSGLGNAYGGIHGSANNTHTTTQTTDPSVTGGAYIDGMGNTTKVERFLPGLGNAMHVPGTLGGITGGSVVTTAPAYTTGGISEDTNWEQKHWQQTASTTFGPTGTGPVAGTLTSAGAGCYTLAETTTAATATLEGPSVTGAGGPATEGIGVWGGCDDHGAAQGRADHGFIKRIVRPVTY